MRLVQLLSATGCALVLLTLPLVQPGRAHMCTPDPSVPVPGALLIPQASGLARLEVSARAVEPLPVLPSSGVVSQVARSLDGSTLAVARFSRRDGESLGGSDILLTGGDGGVVTDRLDRSGPGEVLGAPVWHPRGGLVFERSTVAGGMGSARIDWWRPDGSIATLIDHGSAPTISPDGRWLAYIDATRGDRMLLRDLESGELRLLAADEAFLALAFPRFSPDGQWVAFTAVGEPIGLESLGALAIFPGVHTADAHGIPWDAWAVNVESGALRRISSLYDDDPSVTWSPDGRWIAMLSGEAISVIALDGSAVYCVVTTGGYGGFEWI